MEALRGGIGVISTNVSGIPEIVDSTNGVLIEPNVNELTDVLKHLDKGWDLILAHPPCTYLSNAGARFLYPKGVLNQERLKKGLEAKEFFMKLYNANCPKICVENPVSSKIFEMPQHAQEIQPFEFGHPFKKKTRLWLKGLEPLKPTEIVEVSESTKIAGNWFNKGGKDRQKNRSKTFEGIAKAMAEQWG